ncbi:hypothetical protein [Streptomyces sp. NPDC057676]|uniref:hypothetical protein n=1 Tax=Streptomyces sp. NPDC057676 TaxID=3346205 RepID=UPI0036B81516
MSYTGARVVEQALGAARLLDSRYAEGHFGSATVTAYAKWQRRGGYTGAGADGIPGRATLAALGNRHGFHVA